MISERQVKILAFPYTDYDALICDGAVRSGKTSIMMVSFCDWAMRKFNGMLFGICGKTVDSTIKNVIMPYIAMTRTQKRYKVTWRRSDKVLTLAVGETVNHFEVFGGKDESSYALIQGRTLAGVLLDEVVLQPRSFVEQALARCSVSGSKFWFSCNPASPGHWFFKEWICKAKERNALHLHFNLEDNPSLSAEIIRRFHSLYAGVFYKRYILGQWVAAEGVVYPQFANDPESFLLDNEPPIIRTSIGVDFGGTGSAHSFTLVGFTTGYREIVVLDEYYHSNKEKGVLSPSQLDEDFVDFVRRAMVKYGVYEAFCDSAEQTLIRGLMIAVARNHLPIQVRDARKGPINERIAFYTSMMAQGRFKVMRHCKATIDALSNAVYDSKHPMEDTRLDDGSTNIDSLDSMEYATESIQADIQYLGVRV